MLAAASTCVDALARGHLARRRVQKLRTTRAAAVLTLQSGWRLRAVRLLLREMAAKRKERALARSDAPLAALDEARLLAALVIQRYVRRMQRYNKVKRAMTKHLHAHLLLTELFTDRRRPDAVGAKATRSSPAIARTPSVKVSARLVRLQASTAASEVRRRNGAEMLQSASAKAFGALDHYNAFALSPRRPFVLPPMEPSEEAAPPRPAAAARAPPSARSCLCSSAAPPSPPMRCGETRRSTHRTRWSVAWSSTSGATKWANASAGRTTSAWSSVRPRRAKRAPRPPPRGVCAAVGGDGERRDRPPRLLSVVLIQRNWRMRRQMATELVKLRAMLAFESAMLRSRQREGGGGGDAMSSLLERRKAATRVQARVRGKRARRQAFTASLPAARDDALRKIDSLLGEFSVLVADWNPERWEKVQKASAAELARAKEDPAQTLALAMPPPPPRCRRASSASAPAVRRGRARCVRRWS